MLQLYIVIDVQMKDDCKMRVRCVENERAQIYLKAEFLKSVLGHKMTVSLQLALCCSDLGIIIKKINKAIHPFFHLLLGVWGGTQL